MKGAPFLAKPAVSPRTATVLPLPVRAATPDAARAVHRYAGKRVRWYGQITAVVSLPPMLGLGDVRDDEGVIVWQSLWLHHTPYLRSLALVEGEVLEFVARVDRMLDGSYVLYRPLKVRRVDLSSGE